jgi:hypothetical protein
VLGIIETLGATVSALATVLLVDVHKTGNNSEEELTAFMIIPVAFPLKPPTKVVPVTMPVKVAVVPCKDPARVIPPEALMPAVNLVSALKVPPAELIPAKALMSPDSRITLYPVLPVEYPPTELNGTSGIIQ